MSFPVMPGRLPCFAAWKTAENMLIHLLHKLLQEVLFMCRKNQLLSIAVAAFGLGLLLSGLFDSFFWCSCVGLVFLIVGICLGKKK